ncbi:hypothetical protein HGRIS_001654 [Hohenbuehelia grisea]|uniref:Uncharacterized protein n=1 Tax=Hohenbuehelia grisea TaxID=104357 RepID=A0ABR3JI93_9AGAR
MSSQLFAKRNPFNSRPDGSLDLTYNPHSWLVEAARANPLWIPNPDRPIFQSLDNKKLVPLEKSSPQHFEPGDVIWFCFTIQYIVGHTWWAPEYRLIELIRVARRAEGTYAALETSDSTWIPSEYRQALKNTDEVTIIEDPIWELEEQDDNGDTSPRIGKHRRKRRRVPSESDEGTLDNSSDVEMGSEIAETQVELLVKPAPEDEGGAVRGRKRLKR